uniref:p2C18 n=1 Tax=Arundo donax TaxID=35708 RepID=A0A0A9A6Z6_ARUDO
MVNTHTNTGPQKMYPIATITRVN